MDEMMEEMLSAKQKPMGLEQLGETEKKKLKSMVDDMKSMLSGLGIEEPVSLIKALADSEGGDPDYDDSEMDEEEDFGPKKKMMVAIMRKRMANED